MRDKEIYQVNPQDQQGAGWQGKGNGIKTGRLYGGDTEKHSASNLIREREKSNLWGQLSWLPASGAINLKVSLYYGCASDLCG